MNPFSLNNLNKAKVVIQNRARYGRSQSKSARYQPTVAKVKI